jgi:hypothetical protein
MRNRICSKCILRELKDLINKRLVKCTDMQKNKYQGCDCFISKSGYNDNGEDKIYGEGK